MDNICVNDIIFGEITYNGRWVKYESITMFNKDYNIKIVAKAYSGKNITEQQRASYSKFKDKQHKYLDTIEKHIFDYVNRNANELSSIWNGARAITNPCELQHSINPTTLLIKQDGTSIVLFDCAWDEHGLGVQIFPDFQTGSQDMFL